MRASQLTIVHSE